MSPAVAGGNWRWRCTEEMLTEQPFAWLRDLTGGSKRLAQTETLVAAGGSAAFGSTEAPRAVKVRCRRPACRGRSCRPGVITEIERTYGHTAGIAARKVNESLAWKNLEAHYQKMRDVHLRRLFATIQTAANG